MICFTLYGRWSKLIVPTAIDGRLAGGTMAGLNYILGCGV